MTDAVGALPKELRIALAMRGGVSLAVWIGGAVREIDRLRVAAEQGGGGGDPYADLLAAAGWDEVTIDVLAGTSAGGLNAAIYGTARWFGFDFSQVRDIWLRTGDIESLTRSRFTGRNVWGLPQLGNRPKSLLRGDEYFFTELRSNLIDLSDAVEGPPIPPGQVDVTLSATLWKPAEGAIGADEFAAIPEYRSQGAFHFTEKHVPTTASTEDRERFISTLALAGRATSSFPAAFEPAWLPFTDDATLQEHAVGNMANHFAPGCSPPGCLVIDGGVLDNIPVAKAIDAIAAAPSDSATDRVVVYVNPSPNAAPKETPEFGATNRPFVSDVLATTLTRWTSRESFQDDIDVLRDVNERRSRERVVLEGLVAQIDSAQPTAWLDLRNEAWRCEATQRAARVESWLLAGVSADARPAHRFASRRCIEAACLADPARAASFSSHPRSLALVADLLIAALREIESETTGPIPAAVGVLKLNIYGHRAAALARADEHDQWWRKRFVETEPADITEQWVAQRLADPDRPALDDGAWDGVLADTEGFVVPELETVWSPVLAVIAGANAVRLQRLSQLVGGFWGSNLPSAADLRLVQLVSSAPCQIQDYFPALFSDLAPDDPVQNVKLAGNEISNFAAFVSARWRANDWMWGRLDAAATIIDLCCDPRRLLEANDTAEAATKLLVSAANSDSPNEISEEMTRLFDGDTTTPLTNTKNQILRRIQLDIAREEVAAVLATSHKPPQPGGQPRPEPPSDDELRTLARSYAVGKESLPDTGQWRLSRLVMELGLTGYRSMHKGGLGVALTLLKPLILVGLFVFAAPRAARAVLAIGTAGSVGLIWYRPPDRSVAAWAGFVLVGMGAAAVGAWALRNLFVLREKVGQRPSPALMGGSGSRWRFWDRSAFAVDLAVVGLVLVGLLAGGLRWADGHDVARIRLVAVGVFLIMVIGSLTWMKWRHAIWCTAVATAGYIGGAVAASINGDHIVGVAVKDRISRIVDVNVGVVLLVIFAGIVLSVLRSLFLKHRVPGQVVAFGAGLVIWWVAWFWADDTSPGIGAWAVVALFAASVVQTIWITYADVQGTRNP